ncbi:ParB/RepB/Spo0J family partition protein [Ruminococcus flavefaciens]|uniref:ParB/RepB/Spo0J family partition protein n=1 Tax=Ruminococcus flavefaciens TaxID=1265 RepID=UPI0026F2C499|nr:ParB/RepB/Spo0J family partition protein [Ruminococcus flavefaciens]
MRNNMFDNLKAVVANTRTNDIKMIDIDELHESDDNFFVVENIEQFAQTILGQGGVKDNLIVRPLETGGYEIISGHRRRAAVQYLLDKGENIVRVLPCLVQNYADEDEKMLDLILMNVSARQISDQELWKCYETLDKILKEKKGKGEYFGRIRDDLAASLGVSASQIGKMQNIDNNAVETVKEAVASGELSISTANEIAKLDKTDQSKITDLSKVQPKDIKKKAVATSNNDKKEVVTSNKEGSEKSDNASFSNEFTDVDTNSNDETAVATSDNFSESDEDITKWESAIKGYALLAAERAGFTTEQTNALLGGMIKVLSVFDKSDAEKKYNNR